MTDHNQMTDPNQEVNPDQKTELPGAKETDLPGAKEESGLPGGMAVGRNTRSRVMAWILLAIILVIFIGFIVCLITGSKYMYGMLFLLIFVPVFFYLMLWIKKVFGGNT